MDSNALELAVAHLNAPIGRVLTTEQLARALFSGSLGAIDDPVAAAAAAYLFVETAPSLIAECALAAGADIGRVNRLYRDTLRAQMPLVPVWEQSVEHLL